MNGGGGGGRLPGGGKVRPGLALLSSADSGGQDNVPASNLILLRSPSPAFLLLWGWGGEDKGRVCPWDRPRGGEPGRMPSSRQAQGPALPTQAGPGAVPGGPECTAAGAEAAEGGGAAPTGALLSGGNIRSCFLIFSFLK